MTSKIISQLSSLLFLPVPPIVVASIGRSGSSLLRTAVVACHPNHRFHPGKKTVGKLTRGTAWELKATTLENNIVYKTHDLPCPGKGAEVLYLFIFCKPSRAAISVVKRALTDKDPDWLGKHSIHLGKKATIEDVTRGDALGFAEQLGAWGHFEEAPVMMLKYEKLWESQEVLRRFLGFKIQLPQKRERTPLDSAEYVTAIQENYAHLDAAFATYPDYYLNNRAKQRMRL